LQWLQVPPQGNYVVSFLDVVAPDGAQGIDLHQRLASLKYQIPPTTNPMEVARDTYWFRFGTNAPVSWPTEIGALSGNILLRMTGP
jgi:hypothetical protein